MVGERLLFSEDRLMESVLSRSKESPSPALSHGSFKMSPPDPLVFLSDCEGDWWGGVAGTGC